MNHREIEAKTDRGRNRSIRLLLVALRWGIIIGLGYIFVKFFDLSEVKKHFSKKLLWAAIVLQPIQFLTFLIVSERFYHMLKGGNLRRRDVFEGYVLSIGLNNVLPGRLSEFVKALYLKIKCGMSVATSVAATVLERLIDFAILGSITVVSVSTLWHQAEQSLPLGTAVVVLSIAAIFVLLNEAYLLKFTRFIPFERARRYLERGVHEGMANVRKSGLGSICVLSLILWSVSFLFVYLFLRLVIGETFLVRDGLLVFTGIAVGRAIPSLPAGVGTYEAAATLALTFIGIPKEEAMAYAIALHLSQLFLGAALTLIFLAVDRGQVLPKVWSSLSREGSANVG